MGGWEILIALFGGAWYVVSAIAAAKEKKKKQALRREVLASETQAPQPQEPLGSPSALESPTLQEKSAVISMLETPRDPKPSQATLRAGSEDVGMVKQARKAILESMRKELGLPPSQAPKGAPAAPAPPGGLVVPAVGPVPPPPAQPPVVIAKPRSPRRRDRPAPSQPRATVSRKPIGAQASSQVTAKGLQAVLQSRGGLHQAIVLAELLQQPVSMRPEHLSN